MLKGSALSAIAGMPLTSENYSLVVKLLQERFSRKETIAESLYFKLQNLPKTSNKFLRIMLIPLVLLMRDGSMTTANSNATPMLLASGERVTMD